MSILDLFSINKIKKENELLKQKLDEIGYPEFQDAKTAIKELSKQEKFNTEKEITELKKQLQLEKFHIEKEIERLQEQETFVRKNLSILDYQLNGVHEQVKSKEKQLNSIETELSSKEKQLRTTINKISKNKELILAVDHAINNFLNKDVKFEDCKISNYNMSNIEELSPSVILKLHSMNFTDLKTASNKNNKQIQNLLEKYKDRYTTKTNKAIYSLMVIALQAELQNILVNMKYEKLDKSIGILKSVIQKYLHIASEGNQSIVPTVTRFIGELEYLYINSIKIEYNYYVKKEQAKQEQLAIRARMRQEAEERKALEIEREKIEKEEGKYSVEISRINEQISTTENQNEIELLKARLMELQAQLSDVILKKEEIINLQNGRAGTVYIISNLGSFGKNIFKIGMTRRLDPMDRVNELGDASVPFKFDVHSFIFSEDAVSLETNIHKMLNEKRINKVNRRKEFFNVTLDELEQIVLELQPTAEFNRTIMAEDFRQSLSSENVYSDDFIMDKDLEEVPAID